jgi:hypothetical protein
MIFIYDKAGRVISTSSNLRGIHERNRKQRAASIDVRAHMWGGANFFIKWPDGAWACSEFVSYDVCVEHANRRMFATAEKTIHPRQILDGSHASECGEAV